MTDTSRPRSASSPPAGYQASDAGDDAPYAGDRFSGWVGWIIFAGLMMILLGAFQAIEGLVALFNQGYYLVRPSGLVISVDYTAWGWVHLIIGVLAMLAGVGLMKGNAVARVVGVVLAGLSAIVNLAFIAAYPLWSTIVIAIDIIVIYAIIVHGRELKSI
jgi:hypothetical protein